MLNASTSKALRRVELFEDALRKRACSFCRHQEGDPTLATPGAVIEYVLGGPEATAICDDCVLACASALLERAAVRGNHASRLRLELTAALAEAERRHGREVKGAKADEA